MNASTKKLASFLFFICLISATSTLVGCATRQVEVSPEVSESGLLSEKSIRALKLNDATEAYLRRVMNGQRLAMDGVLPQALQEYENAIAAAQQPDFAPDTLPESTSSIIDVYLAQIDILEQMNDPRGIMQRIGKLEAMEPDNPRWKTLRAETLHRINQPDRALHEAQKALSIDPEYVPAILVQAQVFLTSGNAPATIDTVRKALAIAPDDYEANMLAGRVYVLRDYDVEGGKEAYSRAVEAARSGQEKAAALKGQGEALLRLDQNAEAEQALLDALEIDSSDGSAAYKLAIAQSKQERYVQALESLQLAVDSGLNNMPFASREPAFMPLRSYPEFAALLAALEDTDEVDEETSGF